MITIKVVDESGNSRFFQFESDEIRVGFRPGADVSLKPFDTDGESAEISITLDPGTGYTVDSVRTPGSFALRGKDITGPERLHAGDSIAAGAYHVQIDEIILNTLDPDSDEFNGDATDIDSLSSEDPGAKPAKKESAVSADDPGDSYLTLFFGPSAEYLDDDDVSEIMINGPDDIFIERNGKVQATDAAFINEQALQAAVKNVARSVGRFFNADNPRLDARFPDGSRVHAVIPPVARCGTVVAIRKFRKESLTMDQLVSFGSVTEEGAALISAIVKLHKNVIVSGPTSSGKTCVLNVLSSFIDDNERILVIEDASELQLMKSHAVYFETRKPDEHGKGEVAIRDLVISSLRLRPDRLIVGEIRGGESLDMLQAMNTGHSGSMSTIHANSAVDCLSRIETCALLSGIEIPLSAIRSQVASAVNCVVHTARLSDGSRKITSIAEVLPLENGEYRAQELIYFKPEGMDEDGKLMGTHVGAGVKPTFFDEAALHGIKLEASWFKAPRKKAK